MKKILSFAFVLLLIISLLTGCGSNDGAISRGTKTPSIIASAGNVVFDNNTVTIFLRDVTIKSEDIEFSFDVTNHKDKEFTIGISDLIINGKKVGIGASFHNAKPDKTDLYTEVLIQRNLEIEGFTAEEVKTVQMTFTITDYSIDKVLFEDTALFNI